MELLSQRAYARRRGCSQAAVWKAIQAGRIPVVKVGSGVKIDPEAADRAWARNTDQSKPSNTETGDPAHRRDPAEPAVPMDLDGIEPFEQIPLFEEPARRISFDAGGNGNGNGDGSEDAGDVGSYARHRARREKALARKAELELEEKIGSLVPLNEVEQRAFEDARRARDLLIAIPERIAAVLAAITNPAEILTVLETEIEAVCGELSSGNAERS